MTTESQDLGLTSHPKDGAFYSIVFPSLHWGVRIHTDCRVSIRADSHARLVSKAGSVIGGKSPSPQATQSRVHYRR